MESGSSNRAARLEPELLILIFGIVFRISQVFTFRYNTGFDWPDHWKYINVLATGRFLPPPQLNATTYHPPLYYTMGSILRSMGAGPQSMVLLAGVLASIRLVVSYVFAKRYLPTKVARIMALLLAVFLPSSVHGDAMMTNECANIFFSTCALLVGASVLDREARPREPFVVAVTIGLLVGAAFLSKVSSTVVVAAIACGVIFDRVCEFRAPLRHHATRLAPWALAGGIAIVCAAPLTIDTWRLHGTILRPSGFELVRHLKSDLHGIRTLPVWSRRPLSFFFGWSFSIYSQPFTAKPKPEPPFLPVALAATFNDYYNYGFAVPARNTTNQIGSKKAPRPSAIALARASVTGGTAIALAVAIAWIGVLIAAFRRKRADWIVLMLGPAFAILGQLYFATKYAVDGHGPIKGHYMQFAAAPLFGLYGIAVSWCLERRKSPWRIVGVTLIVAVVPVAAFTLFARLLCPIFDALF